MVSEIVSRATSDDITSALFDRAQNEIFNLMQKDPFRRFRDSDLFRKFTAERKEYGTTPRLARCALLIVGVISQRRRWQVRSVIRWRVIGRSLPSVKRW